MEQKIRHNVPGSSELPISVLQPCGPQQQQRAQARPHDRLEGRLLLLLRNVR